jgi:hypothetical protein
VANAPSADSVPVEHHLVQGFLSHRTGRIPLPLGFLNDDLELPFQLIGIDHRVSKRIGLDVQRGVQSAGRKNGEVAGVVVTGACIEVTTCRLGFSGNVPHTAARSPLEKHVLQDVRDAGPVVRLIEKPGFDVGDNRHHRRRVIRLDQKRQAVGENLAVDVLRPDW